MSLSKIRFPEENPFDRIKVRQILSWLVLFSFVVIFGYNFLFFAIAAVTKINFYTNSDPLIILIVVIHIIFLLDTELIRQCNLVRIDIKQLIGKIPRNYQWLKLIGLVAARFVFFMGIEQIIYYFISFFAYSWVENQLTVKLSNSLYNDRYFQKISTIFSPTSWILIYYILMTILVVGLLFLIYGMVLHRWGTKKTILYFCIFWGIISFINKSFTIMFVISMIVDILLYLQTRTLIVVCIGYMIDGIISLFWNYSGINEYDLSLNLVEQLRDRVWIGVIFLVISTPILVRFIYQNWYRINEPLPYFTNSSQ